MLPIVGVIFLIIQLIKVTNNYLNFESIIRMKVINKYFVEKPVHDIKYGFTQFIFQFINLKTKSRFWNKIIKIILLKMNFRLYIMKSIHSLIARLELREYTKNAIQLEIWPSILWLVAKRLHNSLKRKYHLLNETLIEELSKFDGYPIVRYSQIPSKNINNNKNYTQRFFLWTKVIRKRIQLYEFPRNLLIFLKSLFILH
jgi:hypothetical protein